MHSVRRLRLWLVRFFQELSIGKVVIFLMLGTVAFGVYAMITSMQISDDKRLMPVPTQHKNPIAIPRDWKPDAQ